MGIIKTFQALTRREALGPFLLQAVFYTLPMPSAEYSFVLLGKAGWSFNLYNITSFIGQVGGFAIVMAGVSSIGKWFKYNITIVICLIMFAFYMLLSSTVIFSDKFGQLEYASIYTFCFCLNNLCISLMFNVIVGRISQFLPEGFESTGVTIIISCFNFSQTFGQYLGSMILQSYKVDDGYYDRLEGPQLIGLGFSILAVLACPLFVPNSVRMH